MVKSKEVHIGKEIEKKLQELKISKTDFAEQISTTRQNVHNILLKKDINTDMLQSISEALQFNFFQLFTNDSSKQKLDTTKAKVVIELDLDKNDILKFGLKDKILELIKK